MPLRRTWPRCDPVCPFAGEAMLVLSVAACATSTEATTGARAIRAPRPIATYLLIIAVPLEASRSTLGLRTSFLCASHAELKMNVGFRCRSHKVGAQYCRMCRFRRQRPITRQLKTRASSSPSPFLRIAGRRREHHPALKHSQLHVVRPRPGPRRDIAWPNAERDRKSVV